MRVQGLPGRVRSSVGNFPRGTRIAGRTPEEFPAYALGESPSVRNQSGFLGCAARLPPSTPSTARASLEISHGEAVTGDGSQSCSRRRAGFWLQQILPLWIRAASQVRSPRCRRVARVTRPQRQTTKPATRTDSSYNQDRTQDLPNLEGPRLTSISVFRSAVRARDRDHTVR